RARPGFRLARGHHGTGEAGAAAARRSARAAAVDRPEHLSAVRQRRPAQRVQDVHGRRSPVLHAGAQRAVPVDLLLRSAAGRRPRQLAAAAGGVRFPVCGGFDFLSQGMQTMARMIARTVLLVALVALTTSACSDNTLSQLAAASQTTPTTSTDT